MLKRLSFYFYVFYCFEVGIFLLLVPWLLPQIWETNYFFSQMPWLKPLFMDGYFRGAISGLGILNIVLGVLEIIQNERRRKMI